MTFPPVKRLKIPCLKLPGPIRIRFVPETYTFPAQDVYVSGTKRIRIDHEGHTLCSPALFFLALHVVKLKQTSLMKIEIGESLALSYLKHVKRCIIYQTNWKASSLWTISNEEKKALEVIFEAVRKSEEFRDISKKSEFNQFLRQAEIDALGIDQAGKVYAIDIAFHEKGLRYGSTDEEAAARVTKKLVRSYLAMRSYFPGREYEIIFASPKVGPTRDIVIDKAVESLCRRLEDVNREKFKYITNDAFRDDILRETLRVTKDDADTNELFLRSYKLLRLYCPELKAMFEPKE